MDNNIYKNIILWVVIALVMLMLFNFFNSNQNVRHNISYTDFIREVESGKVQSVTIKENNIYGDSIDRQSFTTYAPKDIDLIRILKKNDVQISAKPVDDSPWYIQILISWLPMILLVGVWIFFMKQMQV